MLLSVACLKRCEVFCFFSDIQKVCGVKSDSNIAAHVQLKLPPSWNLWALVHMPSCCLSHSVLLLLFQVSALQQDQALWSCFCSLFVTSALLLTLMSLDATALLFAVSWAWQLFEVHSLCKGGREGGEDLVIQSLQWEGKPVPSTAAAALYSPLVFAL